MAFRHGRFASITLNAVDLSAFCDNADLSIDVDTSDTTTFGASWKTAIAGLIGSKVDLKGDYDPTASTGPAAVITACITGAVPVACIVGPGGTLTGQLKRTFNCIVTNYTESSPVADKVTFSATLLVTGAITLGTY